MAGLQDGGSPWSPAIHGGLLAVALDLLSSAQEMQNQGREPWAVVVDRGVAAVAAGSPASLRPAQRDDEAPRPWRRPVAQAGIGPHIRTAPDGGQHHHPRPTSEGSARGCASLPPTAAWRQTG